jgi:hypothetical protein
VCFEICGFFLIVGLVNLTDKLTTEISGCGDVQENTVREKKIRDFCYLWKRNSPRRAQVAVTPEASKIAAYSKGTFMGLNV